jgi:hypothetical protein
MQGTDANEKKFWGELFACKPFSRNWVFDTTSGGKIFNNLIRFIIGTADWRDFR